jgi:LCP family protein required for cell wall assembly
MQQLNQLPGAGSREKPSRFRSNNPFKPVKKRTRMSHRLFHFALIFVIISCACSAPFLVNTFVPGNNAQGVSPRAVAQLITTADPNATATPTPFQPLGPTATPRATRTPSPTEIAEDPVITDMPTPIRVTQTMPKGTTNFVVLGNDLRPGGGFRTDVMMLVSINGSKGTVSVISFPRDLYVTIPGWMTQRINTAFARGGFPMLADTLEYNFGVRPTFYVMTNFQGFTGIVNSMGGITVNAGSYLSDTCDIPQSVGGRCTVYAGPVSMDGDMALWYVRSRHTSSDFDRTRRAQEVLYAMFVKTMSRDAISRLPDLYAAYGSSVDTNIGVDDIVPLLPVASQVLTDSSRVKRFAVGPQHVYNYVTEEGAMVLLPNYAAITQLLHEAIFNP